MGRQGYRVVTAVLILGDQLSPDIAALRHPDKARDVIVMAEVQAEADYVPHHPKKIILILSAMRKFAAHLRRDGWRVAYSTLDDAANTHSLLGEVEGRGFAQMMDQLPFERLLIAVGAWRMFRSLPVAR